MSFDITCPTIANSTLDKMSDYESDSNSSIDKCNFLLSNNGIFLGHYDKGMLEKLSISMFENVNEKFPLKTFNSTHIHSISVNIFNFCKKSTSDSNHDIRLINLNMVK